MSTSVKITNLDTNAYWQKQITHEERDHIRNYCESRNRVAIVPAALKPVRTNNLDNFVKDFFFPTLVNRAVKIEQVAARLFAILVAFVFDLVTFPIRLVTAIPRIISNSKLPEHPLHKYLKANHADEKVASAERLLVRLDWISKDLFCATSWTDENGVNHTKPRDQKNWVEIYVDMVEMPKVVGTSMYRASGSTTI